MLVSHGNKLTVKPEKHIHFSQEEGKVLCGQPATSSDVIMRMPNSQLDAVEVLRSPELCAVCYWVWISILAEQDKARKD